MGASHSGHPRSVHMDNETPVGVIDVSDDVVQRLKNGLSKGEQSKKAITTQPTPPPSPPSSSYQNPTPPAQMGTGHPTILYSEPSITAIEVRRQKELELQQNDLYWRKRMSQLEQTLNKTNKIMEDEYSAAVEDVRKRFASAPPSHQLPPCQDLKAQLIACYRAHPGEPLKCSEEVAAFTHCVSENRVKKLDAANNDDVKSAPKANSVGKIPVKAA